MGPHLSLLAILQLVWAAIALLLSGSIFLLAAGAVAIGIGSRADGLSAVATAAVFGAFSVALLVAGALNGWAGLALRRREPAGRFVTLGLAVANLFVLPFGTALGIYAFWVLLHEETRGMFGIRR